MNWHSKGYRPDDWGDAAPPYDSALTNPAGDPGRFVSPRWLNPVVQHPLIADTLRCDNQTAEWLYANGIAVRRAASPAYSDRIPTVEQIHRGQKLEPAADSTVVDYCNGLEFRIHGNDSARWHDVELSPYDDHFAPTRVPVAHLRKRLLGISDDSEVMVDFELPVWRPRSKGELDSLLRRANEQAHSSSPGPLRLWFRGQSNEYRLQRESAICRWLGLHAPPRGDISLTPSLARLRDRDPDVDTYEWAMSGPPHTWIKPFRVWVFKCHPQWFDRCPDTLARITDALGTPDDDTFSRVLLEVQLDAKVGAEANDFRQ